MKKLAILLALLSFNCYADYEFDYLSDKSKWNDKPWTTEDTKWEIAYQVVHFLDWRTTIDIGRRCNHIEIDENRRKEYNPIYNKCPKAGHVNRIMIGTGLLHYAISRSLPANARRFFQVGTFSLTSMIVANNLALGLQVGFRY